MSRVVAIGNVRGTKESIIRKWMCPRCGQGNIYAHEYCCKCGTNKK